MNKKAFTMIEIVVVIAMIVLASSILIGSVIGVVKRNQEKRLSTAQEAMTSAVEMYVSDKGTCPTTQQLIDGSYIAKDLIGSYYAVLKPALPCTVTVTDSVETAVETAVANYLAANGTCPTTGNLTSGSYLLGSIITGYSVGISGTPPCTPITVT